jgi:hypothetical protein
MKSHTLYYHAQIHHDHCFIAIHLASKSYFIITHALIWPLTIF